MSEYIESIIDGLTVVQTEVDTKSRATLISGNRLLIKWGTEATSAFRRIYTPKWVAWAHLQIAKKKSRVAEKKTWKRTVVGGFSVYNLAGKEEVARMLDQILTAVYPLMEEFGVEFASLKESVAEGSLGFTRSSKVIALNVRQTANPALLRKYSAVMSTMIHELAHLRHMDHGRQFQSFERQLKERARALGIYTPGR